MDGLANLYTLLFMLVLVAAGALVIGGVLAWLVYRATRPAPKRGWVVATVGVFPMALAAYLALAWTAYEKTCEWRRVEAIGAKWREAPVGRGSSLQIAPDDHWKYAGGSFLILPRWPAEQMPDSTRVSTIAASRGFVAGQIDRVVDVEDEERTETSYFLVEEATGNMNDYADEASLEEACKRVGMGPVRLVPVREHWAAHRWLVIDIVLLALLAAIPIELGRRLVRRAKALRRPEAKPVTAEASV